MWLTRVDPEAESPQARRPAPVQARGPGGAADRGRTSGRRTPAPGGSRGSASRSRARPAAPAGRPRARRRRRAREGARASARRRQPPSGRPPRRYRPRGRHRGANRAPGRSRTSRSVRARREGRRRRHPTSSTGPGGAIRSSRVASRPRSRRSTQSPGPAKRPSAGRYQRPYEFSSSSSVGTGQVVSAPQLRQSTVPARRPGPGASDRPHQAQAVVSAPRSAGGGAAVSASTLKIAVGLVHETPVPAGNLPPMSVADRAKPRRGAASRAWSVVRLAARCSPRWPSLGPSLRWA